LVFIYYTKNAQKGYSLWAQYLVVNLLYAETKKRLQ